MGRRKESSVPIAPKCVVQSDQSICSEMIDLDQRYPTTGSLCLFLRTGWREGPVLHFSILFLGPTKRIPGSKTCPRSAFQEKTASCALHHWHKPNNRNPPVALEPRKASKLHLEAMSTLPLEGVGAAQSSFIESNPPPEPQTLVYLARLSSNVCPCRTFFSWNGQGALRAPEPPRCSPRSRALKSAAPLTPLTLSAGPCGSRSTRSRSPPA